MRMLLIDLLILLYIFQIVEYTPEVRPFYLLFAAWLREFYLALLRYFFQKDVFLFKQKSTNFQTRFTKCTGIIFCSEIYTFIFKTSKKS